MALEFRVGNTASDLDNFWTLCYNVDVDISNLKDLNENDERNQIMKKVIK